MSYIVNLTGVQPTLVSGENIKTINGETILGSGDLTIDKTDVGLGNVDNTSDADKPISTATQTALDNKADLVGGKVPSSQIPAIAISEFLGAVNSQAAMLALLGQEGDWCIRTDVDLTYILIGTDPTDIDNWQEIVTPTGAVTSVNGYTGVVVLDQNDIGLGNVDDTSDLNKPISTATQTALNAKQDSLVSGTNIKTLEGQSLLGSGNIDLTKSDVGLSNVDNTSDLNKPISTATQTALNGKFNNPTGTSAQYIDGTGALQTFPTILDAGSLITEVYNNTGATLTKGTIVYINGGQGNLPTITKANASADATSAQTFGWVRNDITNNNNGYVIVAGKLSDLNTNGLGTGTQLYLSGTTSGAYTITKPQAPIHLVYVGVVVRDHPTQGVIEVKIQNGYEVDELHDVQIASIANNQVLQYESSTQLWKNKSLTTASVAASTDKNYVTDAQQVVIGNTSGTNTGDETQATIQSKLGTASTSTSGYLTSTDWNTFNGKQNALTLTTTGTSGAATLVGSTLNIPNYASGSTGGRFGIADSTGAYTYYTTLSLAMAAATAGQTIEMFTDYTETGAVTITLKNGVNINGNGHTYTHSYAAGNSNTFENISGVISCVFSNLRVIRTGRPNGTTGDYVLNTSVNDSQFFFNGVFMESTYGNCVSLGGTTFQYKPHSGDLYAKAYLTAITTQGSITGFKGQSTSSGKGIYGLGNPLITSCVGMSISGDGINGIGNNCYGFSTSGIALAGYFSNSYGNSVTYRAGDGNAYYNCVLVSTSGYAATNGQYKNCTCISSSGSGAGPYLLNKHDNCYIESASNVAVGGTYTGIFRNCVVVSDWNNSGGHGFNIGNGSIITNSHVKVANTSANCIYYGSAINMKYTSNVFEGATTPVNANITQAIVNTEDNQGNILL